MASTQSVKEHLKVVRDQIQTASEKQGEEAKSAVRSALTHLDAARKEFEAQTKSDMTQDNAARATMLEHLQTAAQDGAQALKESGEQMRVNIRHMLDTTETILTKDV